VRVGVEEAGHAFGVQPDEQFVQVHVGVHQAEGVQHQRVVGHLLGRRVFLEVGARAVEHFLRGEEGQLHRLLGLKPAVDDDEGFDLINAGLDLGRAEGGLRRGQRARLIGEDAAGQQHDAQGAGAQRHEEDDDADDDGLGRHGRYCT
jgi:hypothetical protein